MSPERDWTNAAFEVYRLAQAELLERLRGEQRPEIAYYVDELREALLDLKEATLSDDAIRALEHMSEVAVLMRELRLRYRGDQ